MGVSKINFGGRTLIDLTGDTVTADSLQEGYTAHGADGEPIVGRGTGGGNSANYYSIEDEASNAIANDDYIPFYDSTGEVKTKILFSTLKAAIDTDTKDWASITGKPSTFPPSSHTHSWDSITGKPSSFTPAAHTHAWDDITGKPSTFTPASHTHAWSEITGKPSTFAPSAHTHDNITTQTLSAVKDANTVGANGKLTVDSFIAGSSQNLPDSSNTFTVMTSKNSDGTKAFQIAGSHTSHYAYFRNYADGTGWSSWYSMRNTNVTVTNNLTSSSSTGTALSAAQGYNLANGSARDSTKMPLAGGTFTGQVKSSYKGAGTWIGGVTNAAFTITGTGYSAWMCGPTQSGNISISTYTSNNNLYFGYAVSGRTENSFNHQMYWDAPNNNLVAGKFSGDINVNRVAKDANSALPGTNRMRLEEFNSGSNYNLPSNHWYYIMTMQGGDSKYGAQLALGMTTQGAYYRKYDNGSWGSWVAFKTQADINSAVAAAKVGTAGQAQVLSGYTFTNASTSGLTGTMANCSSGWQWNNNTSVGAFGQADYTWSSGGTEKMAFVRPRNAGYYTLNSQVILETVASMAPKIKSGTTVCGVSGTFASQEKTITASRSAQTVTPDSGKWLSKVTVNKFPDATGTYPVEGSGGEAVDMGISNNYRYVNTTNVYNAGYSAGKKAAYLAYRVLWQNSSTGSSFASQNVTLAEDIDNYIALAFEYQVSTSDTTASMIMVRIAEFKAMPDSSGKLSFCMAHRDSSVAYQRRAAYVSDTVVKIFGCNRTTDGTSFNGRVIPRKIYGVYIA